MPLSDTKDSSPGDSPPAPTNTFTISFTGIQALELTVSSAEDITVNAIVRLADEPAPVWADIKDKVGLLSRNIVANTPKRIFTAKHYGTNDSLKTNIGAMSAADILQPETAYKVHVFHDESPIETLPFTTAAIPPASEFPSTHTGHSLNFAPNVLPLNTERTYSVNDVEKKGMYEVYGKEGEVLLVPMYMKELLTDAWRVSNATVELGSCNLLNACLADPGYAITPEFIYESVAAKTYHKVLLGFQSFNKSTTRDAGDGFIRDGAQDPYLIHSIADK
ncbi:hypothetical protein P0082_08265 [Candidatus Haliotispira prima]|uniref:Uncharacterized protein n=1 Tax=Candidatus Haliotispira prima TaxID=3034016 RepID=A0ABY8MER2_9SPIO|nr:hypothetical protein P0082_08265 [Candidatus Haliotispira prima]